MAQIALPITLGLTVVRTFFVADAVLAIRGHGSIISRVAHATTSIGSQTASQGGGTAPIQSVGTSRGRPVSPGIPKHRFLHIALLVAHVMAIVGMVAALLKYVLPVSDTSCRVTHKVMIAFFLFYDASLLIFLLAKVNVTNDSRRLACWEKVIVWIGRAYAWLYLPVIAFGTSISFHAEANDEGTFCDVGYKQDKWRDEEDIKKNAIGYVSNNASLIVQFVLLLVLFLRPLLGRLEATQSGAAVYRKVVMRNVVCTVAIVVAYCITTVVMVFALLQHGHEDGTASQYADSAPVINELVTLCLTEISLPLGFVSFWKASNIGRCAWGSSAKERLDCVTALTSKATTTGGKNNNSAVIPVDVSRQIP